MAASDITLNEIVSSNGATVSDEDGDFEDWLEIHNSGPAVVDLSGWGLTDSPLSPFKWTFPAGASIAPGEHLLIWASNKNRAVAGLPLHTNFSISAAGETIVLTLPGGTTADSVALPAVPRDTSYGRKPGFGSTWFYFEQTTPAAANTTPGFETLPPLPVFSSAGGFHTSALNLELTAAPGWTIYYTLDGSDPDPARVGPGQQPYRESHMYSAPITVASRAGDPNVFSMIPTTKSPKAIFGEDWMPEWREPDGEVFKATVVRAAAYENASGRLGRAVTRTYFVDPDIHTRYQGMPVVSLVSDYVNLFDDDTGIYVPGSAATNQDNQNFFQDWVRAANIEFFEAGGAPAFSDQFEINIQGSSSPMSMQKGIKVSTGADSAENLINYPLFAGRGSSASHITKFESFILRSWGSARKWAVPFSDAHHQTLAAHSGLEIQDYRPVIVFINGEYWGLHELRESNKNSWYHQFRTGIDRASPGYDLLDEGGGVIDEGDDIHWDALMQYVNLNYALHDEVYQYVTTQVDVENLARYIAHCIISGKRDWPLQNESMWRPRTPDGRWRWTQYDMDHGLVDWSQPSYNMLSQAVDGNSGYGPHWLFLELLANAKFKRLFINTYLDWLNSYFLTDVELAHFDAMKAELDPFIAEFNSRWPIELPDNYYMGWQPGIDYGRSLIQGRRNERLSQLVNYFGLGQERQLTLGADPSMGVIRCNSLVVDETTPGVDPAAPYPWVRGYYQNFPVELTAMPRGDHRFLGWIVKKDGANLPHLPDGNDEYYSRNAVIDVAMTGAMNAEAVFEAVTYQDLHVWNFENASLTLPSYTVGGGLLTATPSAGGNMVLESAGKGFTSTHLRVNSPIGAQLEWALPTTGQQWPRLGFLTRRSGTGAGLQHLSYTLDGTTWTEFASYAVADDVPQQKTFDFSSIAGSGNNPDFAVRIAFEQGGGGTDGNNRFDDVTLSVANFPDYPFATAQISNLEVVAGGPPVQIDLVDFFSKPGGGTPAFQVQTSTPGVASVALSSPLLDIAGLIAGETTINVVALFNGQPTVAQSFRVLVYPAPFHVGGGGIYRFDEWATTQPASTYPAHMIFLQSEVSDPLRNTPLPRAYAIPSGDAAAPADVGFPYAATSRTRINGLAASGISFLNTGRARDLGAALLALDTTGQSGVFVKWTAGTVTVNDRIYALSLQYRTNPSAAWTDFSSTEMPVEYIRSEQAGHEQVFGPVRLPAELENQPYVQLQWRYHYISGDLNARAEIRLDDIVVTTGTSYESWANLAFSGTELQNPGLSDPLAQYSSDGTPNLIKYALGLQPWDPVRDASLAAGINGGGQLFMRFHLDRSLGDITYRVLASPDMMDWSEVVFDSSVTPGPNSDGDMHEVLVPTGGLPHRFLRLGVTRE